MSTSNRTSPLVLSAFALLTGFAMSNPVNAQVEVEASAAVASMYLYRGLNLSGGTPSVSGDLIATHDTGLYGGMWIGSGDEALGTEVDFFAGWSGEFSGVTLDVNGYNYYYPADEEYDSVGELSEVQVSLGAGPFMLGHSEFVAGSKGTYTYVSGEYKAFSVLFGWSDAEDPEDQAWSNDYGHVDISYAHTEHLTFTLSQVVGVDDEAIIDGSVVSDDDLLVMVSYSLPVEL